MNCKCCLIAASVLSIGALAGSFAFAQSSTREKPSAPAAAPQGDMQLPPGWTEADMQACKIAGTPGEMHQHLMEGVGVWQGNTKMWMAPDTEPMTSTCTFTVKELYDGRYVKGEMTGEMPGMGMFNGFGLYGFDNVAQEFQSTWIDNHSTGIMTGKGDLSSDGKTLTWKFHYNCPVTKKQTTMREVERITGKNTKTLEMFGIDPKSGEEFKMMEIALTRKAGTAAASAGTE